MGRFLTTGLATLTVGALVGCGGDGNNGGNNGTPAQSFDYVVSGLTIDNDMNVAAPAMITAGVAGFDLDGRKTGPTPAAGAHADCTHGDFFSTLDTDQNEGTCSAGMPRGGPTCRGGVDNQLPTIADTLRDLAMIDVRGALSDQLRGGNVSILMRVSDVNGTPGPSLNDSSVTVRFYPVGRPLFASCSSVGMPDQMYAVDQMSLRTPGDLNSSVITYQGSIVNGRLRINPPADRTMPNFTLPLPISGTNVTLNLYATQFRMDLTPEGGARGNLGGYIRLADLVSAIRMIPNLPITPQQIQMFAPVLAGFIDIEVPSGDAMGCGERLDAMGIPSTGGIGLGLGLTAVRARIAAAPVMGAQPGMCGSSGSGGGDGGARDASARD